MGVAIAAAIAVLTGIGAGIGIGLSLLFFLIGNSFGKTVDDETLEIFFPERFDK